MKKTIVALFLLLSATLSTAIVELQPSSCEADDTSSSKVITNKKCSKFSSLPLRMNSSKLSSQTSQESLAERCKLIQGSGVPVSLQRHLLGIDFPLRESSLTSSRNSTQSNKAYNELPAIQWKPALPGFRMIGTLASSTISSFMFGYPFATLDWKNLLLLAATSPWFEPRRITSYFLGKILPVVVTVLHKMALMEVWRLLWIQLFSSMRLFYQALFAVSYYDSFWESYAPFWLRRGVRALFVKKIQGHLEKLLTPWLSWRVTCSYFSTSVDNESSVATFDDSHDTRLDSSDS